MRFEEKNPPREFEVGYEKKSRMKDCGSILLGDDEQVTFKTAAGGEYDLAKKCWGFYATPSINGRLANFGLRSVLVRNRDDRFFVLIVEKGKEAEFEEYATGEPLTLICWLDELENLKSIEKLFREQNG
jgi:hypothetical protein